MVSLPQWRRIYHQTLTLVHKNLLVFYKSPVVTLIRAFIVPIAITIIFCFLKDIKNESDAPYGISHNGQPVMDLPDAVAASSSQRLVFVINDIHSPDLNSSLNAIFREPGMGQFDIQVVNDPRSLMDVCRQSIHGTSNCFASVIFTAFNKTNVEYSIGLDADPMYNTPYSYAPGQSIFSQRLLPLQWAVDSHLGGFASAQKPTEKMWNGYFKEDGSSHFKTGSEVYWLTIVQNFGAILFVFILLAATHHMSSAVAGERQNSLAELLMAQGVRTTPRVLSNLISFFILYAPGVIICSILLGEILFTHTSTGIMFILMLLACLSFIVCAHFIGSFFAKASLAGLCASVLTFALSLITITQNLTGVKSPGQNIALSLLFPPYAWASVISDIAALENIQHGFPDPILLRKGESIDGGLFFLFFILQILFYGGGTFLVEHFRWGVPRQHEWTETSDEIALRLGHLRKTFDRGKKVAVEDLNVEVRKGSVTFLLGPNGSGKTTTLKCISGMLKLDQGSSIQFSTDGHSFGLCPQNNVSFPSLHSSCANSVGSLGPSECQ
jgi:ABC-type multidrug transport system fused ATPase/permease subunit